MTPKRLEHLKNRFEENERLTFDECVELLEGLDEVRAERDLLAGLLEQECDCIDLEGGIAVARCEGGWKYGRVANWQEWGETCPTALAAIRAAQKGGVN